MAHSTALKAADTNNIQQYMPKPDKKSKKQTKPKTPAPPTEAQTETVHKPKKTSTLPIPGQTW